ncbi:MAG TPA: sigma-70 family RNA polymerase sigma factor [Myxococcaceae bacterium]|nr:sigma-70 family RNA polymerase sigma factor [Myxococcaceae bacterium]
MGLAEAGAHGFREVLARPWQHLPAVQETPPALATLAPRIRAGDRSAEDELVRAFSRGVRVILRHVARDPALVDDLHQETFRVGLERIRAGALRDETQAGAFLAGLARNLAIEHFRKARRTVPEDEAGLERTPSPAASASEQLEREEDAQRVARVLEALPTERDRAVLRRFYLGQEDKDALCAELGVDRLQFNRIVHRARERFRALWNPGDISGGGDT